jgi:phage-related protein
MIERKLKPVVWIASSYSDLKSFPSAAQRRLGHELYLVQIGTVPHDYKPMKPIGSAVYEIRAHVGTEHRLIYLAKYQEAVYVLHAFQKKSQKTSKRDIETARKRLALVEQHRRQQA